MGESKVKKEENKGKIKSLFKSTKITKIDKEKWINFNRNRTFRSNDVLRLLYYEFANMSMGKARKHQENLAKKHSKLIKVSNKLEV